MLCNIYFSKYIILFIIIINIMRWWLYDDNPLRLLEHHMQYVFSFSEINYYSWLKSLIYSAIGPYLAERWIHIIPEFICAKVNAMSLPIQLSDSHYATHTHTLYTYIRTHTHTHFLSISICLSISLYLSFTQHTQEHTIDFG